MGFPVSSNKKLLCVDLYCGLGGWAEGFIAEGYRVVGFDIERWPYPGQLILQDALTLHGSQFKDATVIVASPPCQAYSYRAMPWKRAKALPPPDNTLFDACFRIQREASEAAGHKIPLIVENVRGAQKWVGRAKWNWGSYYLWGDVPALMPMTTRVPKFILDDVKNGQRRQIDGLYENGRKSTGMNWSNREIRGQDFTRLAGQFSATKNTGFRFDGSGRLFQSESVDRYIKNNGGSWFNVANNTTSGVGKNARDDLVRELTDGRKVGKDWFGGYGGGFGWDCSPMRRNSSKSSARKQASAMIAKIPFPLARHIARVFKEIR